jgi:hypothetical protein
MPYTSHPSCQPPDDENALIWRYIDLAKFVSMLDHHALFFSQTTRLTDRFEGSYPEPNVRAREFSSRVRPLSHQWAMAHKTARSLVYVNCWHHNEYESAAIWDLYGQRDSGIAICSTFARLRDSMASTPEHITIGMVNYIDYARDRMPENNELDPFLHKRLSYAHEQELRALYIDPTLPEETPAGLDIDCDLDTLIDAIFVSPKAASWFRDVVTSITEQYEIAKQVRQSNLDDDPVF